MFREVFEDVDEFMPRFLTVNTEGTVDAANGTSIAVPCVTVANIKNFSWWDAGVIFVISWVETQFLRGIELGPGQHQLFSSWVDCV